VATKPVRYPYKINLREEVDIIMRDHGHWCWLLVVDLTVRCLCVEAKTITANPNCAICMGLGYEYEEKRVLSRRRLSSGLQTLFTTEQLTDPGMLSPVGNFYYFEHHVHPKPQDVIIEKDDNDNVYEVFDIELVEPLREKRGRIEYYRVAVNKRSVNRDWLARFMSPSQIHGRHTIGTGA